MSPDRQEGVSPCGAIIRQRPRPPVLVAARPRQGGASRCDAPHPTAATVSLAILVLLLAGPFLATRAEAASLTLRDGDRVLLLGNTFLERDRHFGHFEQMLRSRFPGTKFTLRNLAWPGDTTTVQMRPLNFGSMESHIRKQQPSVIFAAYGMNASFEGQAGLTEFIEGYERILDILEGTEARIVMISPIRHENLGPPLPAPARHNGELAIYVEAIAKLAQKRRHVFVNLFDNLIQPSTERVADPFTTNGIHLSDYGFWHASEALAQALGWKRPNWNVKIENGEIIGQTGTVLTAVGWADQELRFEARDLTLPHLRPAGQPRAAKQLQTAQTLTVEGLRRGASYALRIDGQLVAVASAEQWAKGVELREAPQHDRARKMRDRIQYRERLFFYRWRSHNGEYIYGRRAKRQGKIFEPKFPQEMAEFERLVEKTDQEIQELAAPRAVRYELRRQM